MSTVCPHAHLLARSVHAARQLHCVWRSGRCHIKRETSTAASVQFVSVSVMHSRLINALLDSAMYLVLRSALIDRNRSDLMKVKSVSGVQCFVVYHYSSTAAICLRFREHSV